MGNKDRPGKPKKKAREHNAEEQLTEKRAKRKERKHNLKILRRKARRRGAQPLATPQIQ